MGEVIYEVGENLFYFNYHLYFLTLFTKDDTICKFRKQSWRWEDCEEAFLRSGHSCQRVRLPLLWRWVSPQFASTASDRLSSIRTSPKCTVSFNMIARVRIKLSPLSEWFCGIGSIWRSPAWPLQSICRWCLAIWEMQRNTNRCRNSPSRSGIAAVSASTEPCRLPISPPQQCSRSHSSFRPQTKSDSAKLLRANKWILLNLIAQRWKSNLVDSGSLFSSQIRCDSSGLDELLT